MKTVKSWKTGKYKQYRVAKGKTGYHIYIGNVSATLNVFDTETQAIEFLKQTLK